MFMEDTDNTRWLAWPGPVQQEVSLSLSHTARCIQNQTTEITKL
jgi:hypothetical protein